MSGFHYFYLHNFIFNVLDGKKYMLSLYVMARLSVRVKVGVSYLT